MGCNCNKTREQREAARQAAARQAAANGPGKAPTPRPQTTTDTQNQRASQQSFALEVNGSTQSFGSRLEADAANRRSFGGRGTVRPA